MTKVPDAWIELIIDAVDGQLRAHVSHNEELPNRSICTEVYHGMIASKETAEQIAMHAAAARGYREYRIKDRTR